MKITAENLYELYHRYNMLSTKGIVPRKIKNWDNIKKKHEWYIFERTAMKLNRADIINLELYIKSLSEYFEGYIQPKFIGSPVSFKIYRATIKQLNMLDDIVDIQKSISLSLNNIKKYCKNNDIRFKNYLEENIITIPTLLKHYYNGTISKYFVCIIPNIHNILRKYPIDIKNEYINFDVNKIKIKIITNTKIKKISQIIEKYIDK